MLRTGWERAGAHRRARGARVDRPAELPRRPDGARRRGRGGRPRPAGARRRPRGGRHGARHVPARARGDAARGPRAPRRARARPAALRLPLLRGLRPALRRAACAGAGARPGDRAGARGRLLGRRRGEGLAAERVSFSRQVDLRFRRQTWEVTVPFVDAGRLGDAFRARYAELYGTGALAAAAPIDLVNCRVIATARLPRPALAPAPLGPTDASPAQRGVRTVWLPGGEDGRPVALYDGERLAPGMAFTGPALVERRDTTILVLAGDGAHFDAWGSLVIEVSRG